MNVVLSDLAVMLLIAASLVLLVLAAAAVIYLPMGWLTDRAANKRRAARSALNVKPTDEPDTAGSKVPRP